MASPEPPPPATPRTIASFLSSELGRRTLSGIALVVLALGTAWWGGLAFDLLWALAGALVCREWVALSPARDEPALALGGAAAVAVAAIILSVSGNLPSALTALAVGAAGLATLGRNRTSRLWALAGLLYAAVIGLVPVAARALPDVGLVVILWMFAVVWMTDIAAYFSGRTLGGPKLWPSVSPKKTWSGFFGGLAAGCLAGMTVVAVAQGYGVAQQVPLWLIGIASALASALGQLGDLAESALKRRAGVKDSGQIIPGHGGVMDRLDAFWAVALLVGMGLVVGAVVRASAL